MRIGGGLGYSLAWLADLDGDGRQDLILNHFTQGVGRCTARSRLTTILSDGEGRPSPWEAEGYYRVDFSWEPLGGKGVLDFADWNKHGGVELVFAQCYSYSYQSARTNVYGLVDVYEARGGYWHRLSTTERQGLEKTYLDVAGRGYRVLRPRPEELGSFEPDHSNDRAGGKKAVIRALISRQPDCGGVSPPSLVKSGPYIGITKPTGEWKRKQRERCNDRFMLDDGTSCYGKPAILIDRPSGTEATLDGMSGRAKSLLEEIVSNKLPVTMTGQTREGLCSPSMIWAEHP